MIYSIENECLYVSVDTAGAQLASIRSKKTGVEYLWQGDKTYWGGRAYNLFPFIGRMTGGVYTYQGNTYTIRPHGLARYYQFSLQSKSQTEMTFLLTDESSEDMLSQYPFRFSFFVTFSLKENKLLTNYKVVNKETEKELICTLGGHPGINVPFAGGTFEDYCVEFEHATPIIQHLLSENKFMSGNSAPYHLEDGVRMPLQHSLFDNDALIFTGTCGTVSIKKNIADTGKTTYVKMRYDGFKYFALWQATNTDAPFLCLEPWQSVCSTEGIIDDLATKADMLHIPPCGESHASFSLEIGE